MNHQDSDALSRLKTTREDYSQLDDDVLVCMAHTTGENQFQDAILSPEQQPYHSPPKTVRATIKPSNWC